MISIIANTVNLFASLVQYVFVLASLAGKLIVTFVVSIFSTVYSSIECVLLFFRIIYEDNINIFTEEIPNLTVNLIEMIVNQCIQVGNRLAFFYYDVDNKLNLLIGTIRWSFEEVVLIIRDILLLWKKTVIFLGETLWLVITFIPLHLPYLLKEICNTIMNSIYTVVITLYMSLLNFTNFLTDVPLQSFTGILLTMTIVRLAIHYREFLEFQVIGLYWTFHRKVLFIYYTFYNYFIDSETRHITQMANSQQRETQDVISGISDLSNGAESLCIICQERQKCVLTLPCRHVCLCTECCRRLYGYQRTCPICRTFIYHSVNVYL